MIREIQTELRLGKRASDARYYAENREVIRAKRKAHYEANREREIARARVWQQDHPERRRVINRRARLRSFGLTEKAYEEMWVLQSGTCAICRQPERTNPQLAIDHDHTTGDVRGLLCTTCNTRIGAFGDSALLLRSALIYLGGVL